MPPQSLIIALCLIVHDERILLIRRSKPPYQGWQGLPGGKVHFGEMPAEAARREAREETGLTFAEARTLGCATETIRRNKEAFAHFIMFPVLLTSPEGTLQEGEEGALMWHRLAALPYDMIPTDRDLLSRFFSSPASGKPLETGVPHYDIAEEADGYYIRSITGSGARIEA